MTKTGDNPNCSNCGIPLTAQEAAAGSICYMCAIPRIQEMAEQLKKKIDLPDPAVYGRTKEEVDAYLAKKSSMLPSMSSTPIPTKDEGSIVVDGISWTTEDRKEMVKNFGWDPGKKPLTTIRAHTDQFTTLEFKIPETMDPAYKSLVQRILDNTLTEILRILTFGPHFPGMENFLKEEP